MTVRKSSPAKPSIKDRAENFDMSGLNRALAESHIAISFQRRTTAPSRVAAKGHGR
jgi:hypothetical protein